MVFAARDLSKPNTDALAMEEHGNEMKVTKRGRKIDEGAGEGVEAASTNPSQLLNSSPFLKKASLEACVTLRINRDRETIDLWILKRFMDFELRMSKKYIYLFILC